MHLFPLPERLPLTYFSATPTSISVGRVISAVNLNPYYTAPSVLRQDSVRDTEPHVARITVIEVSVLKNRPEPKKRPPPKGSGLVVHDVPVGESRQAV